MKNHIDATPFTLVVTDPILADLKARLAQTRWPNEAATTPWRYGASLDYVRRAVDHWQHRYDWRGAEAGINRWPQYLATIRGETIHFIMERGSGPNPLPLILTHGWPGSFAEFLEIIEPLAHPERFGGDAKDAFTVIVPSLPGFGCSPPPRLPVTPQQIATIWHELMTGVLGCEHYVAQGGDWGAIVTSYLALNHPQALAAIHTNSVGFMPNLVGAEPLNAEEDAWRIANDKQRARETGYVALQSTKPQTLAYALTDSPAGLAAWILEKFHGWTVGVTDPPKPVDPPYPLDRLLTNVMLYWLNGINGANWMYTSFQDPTLRIPPQGQRVEVPTGMLICPSDLSLPAPDRWIRRMFNLVDRRDAPHGGHFIAFEEPTYFVKELRQFFSGYRR